MENSVRCIVCETPGKFRKSTRAIADPGEGEVLVQIKSIGICGTDLHAYAGNQPFFQYPRVLGHELSGRVESVGAGVTSLLPEDQVLIMPYLHCGTCVACRSGKTNCCTSLQVLGVHADGGMCEKMVLPASILMPIPDLSYAEIAIVEPLSIGAHAVRRADLQKNDFVVVVGCGPIGLGIAKFAQLAGAQVIAIDMVEDRLAFARRELGIPYGIQGADEPLEEVKKITGGDLAAVVFDATGHPKALESGHQYMSHGGSYVLVGLYKGELALHHPSLHAKEASVLCSRNATLADFQRVVEVLRQGNFPSDKFITHRVTFDDMIDNFEGWLDPAQGVIKAMVDFN